MKIDDTFPDFNFLSKARLFCRGFLRFISVFFLLSALCFSWSCGGKSAAPSKARSSQNDAVFDTKLFFEKYGQIVHPFAVEKCGGCHSKTAPMFATGNALESAQVVFQTKKIDFANPGNSRLVQRLTKDSHNCGAKDQCELLGIEMKKKVEQVIAAMGKMTESFPNLTPSALLKDARMMTRFVGNTSEICLEGESSSFSRQQEGSQFYVKPLTTPADLSAKIDQAGAKYIWAYYRRGASGTLAVGGNYMEQPPSAAGATSKPLPVAFPLADTGGKFKWALLNPFNAQTVAVTAFNMESQSLSLKLSGSNVDLDFFLITDVDYKKSVKGEPTAEYSVLDFDLSSLKINGKLEIGASIYDPLSSKSYIFSAPRYIGAGKVRFKGMKILINGKWNPVHSTFYSIDQVVETGGYLSSSAMTVGSENIETDKISISFESITSE